MDFQLRSSRFIAIAIALGLVVGCQSSSKQSKPPPEPAKPAANDPAAAVNRGTVNAKALIDFTRGTGGFPLAGDSLPASIDELIASMTKAYRQRADLPPDVQSPVVATGDYPNLDLLRIDMTGARVKPDFKPKSFQSPTRESNGLHVKRVEYVARPLQYVDGKTYLSITADDVTLNLLRAKPGAAKAKGADAQDDNAATLVMTEASNGRALFEVAIADLRTMFRMTAKSGTGNRGGYVVRNVDFAVKSDDPRSLSCEMRVSGFWFVLPTSFAFTGRVDVDDNFNAHLSNISCHGTDVGGLLFAGIVDNAIKKYEGRVMPLASFPGGKIQVRDLAISVDDAVHIDIAFSSLSGAGKGS